MVFSVAARTRDKVRILSGLKNLVRGILVRIDSLESREGGWIVEAMISCG